jgi:hypothetical protein
LKNLLDPHDAPPRRLLIGRAVDAKPGPVVQMMRLPAALLGLQQQVLHLPRFNHRPQPKLLEPFLQLLMFGFGQLREF